MNSRLVDPMDDRIRKAATLPRTLIEASIPSTLVDKLKIAGESLSVSWSGILIGLTQPVQFVMDYSTVAIEMHDFREPTIFWPLHYSPSATQKTNIYRFVRDVVKTLEDDDVEFNLCETTFEKLGILTQKNNGKIVWQFDEARHFFAQLGLYQKVPSRDEGTLLFLYDGSAWDHATAKGVQFTNEYTKLSLGGLTQTGHILNLFSPAHEEQMTSGLIPRFFIIGLEPVHSSIRTVTGDSDEVKKDVIKKVCIVKKYHQTKTNYTILRGSKALELYAQYDDKIESWIKKI